LRQDRRHDRKERAMAINAATEIMIRELLIGSPVAKTLGVTADVIAVDRIVLRLPFSPANVTVKSIVHGGVIATLIDIAGAAASFSGAPPGSLGATSTLAISYIAPADGAELTAEARVIQRGRSQTVAEVAVRDAAGRLVAQALSTNRLFPPK
jgi:uncharacterized protein (TIGR00369 family)